MNSRMDISKYLKKLESRAEDALKVLGGQGITWASANLRKNKSVITSNLINSITFSTSNEAPAPTEKTDGTALQLADKMTVRIGTNVVYAPRVEFGFVGEDSLGRVYNQPAKPYLRTIIKQNKSKIISILKQSLKNG